ncbi:hypothetical protein [Salibacterium qingdaonense]|uniref:Uncharacterized protein n=1 Tax=Salibacterium qingdaonense TaxID=266892 RepID=A0A1I4IQY0_9BACI|nr:hypothetical protein [Salibacterium qingdaonense]SFL56704.1 hypothetical protein SAMN04488054_102182 [Salibacterium qingdaonense]
MAFASFFFAAWFITTAFLMMPKKLSIIENTFVFMVILIININWGWIVYESMERIELTEEGMIYTAFLLLRSVIIPVILITQLNLVHKSNMIFVVLVSLIILLFLSSLSAILNIADYVKWNLGFDAIYYLLLHVIAYYSLLLIRKIADREVTYT